MLLRVQDPLLGVLISAVPTCGEYFIIFPVPEILIGFPVLFYRVGNKVHLLGRCCLGVRICCSPMVVPLLIVDGGYIIFRGVRLDSERKT